MCKFFAGGWGLCVKHQSPQKGQTLLQALHIPRPIAVDNRSLQADISAESSLLEHSEELGKVDAPFARMQVAAIVVRRVRAPVVIFDVYVAHQVILP